jgi:hypothetical protein
MQKGTGLLGGIPAIQMNKMMRMDPPNRFAIQKRGFRPYRVAQRDIPAEYGASPSATPMSLVHLQDR